MNVMTVQNVKCYPLVDREENVAEQHSKLTHPFHLLSRNVCAS